MHGQGREAPLSPGEPTRRRGVRLGRVGQDGLLLRGEEGLDFSQRLHQVVQESHEAVPLTCGGRGTTVLPVRRTT